MVKSTLCDGVTKRNMKPGDDFSILLLGKLVFAISTMNGLKSRISGLKRLRTHWEGIRVNRKAVKSQNKTPGSREATHTVGTTCIPFSQHQGSSENECKDRLPSLTINRPVSHLGVSMFNSWLGLLIQAYHKCGP